MSGLDSARLVLDASAFDLSLNADQVHQLEIYADLVTKWNKHFNLIARPDIRRLQDRHLLDSLAIARVLRGQRILDIGSGAGLPGIPLAIVQPDRLFVLCDRMSRRCRFLSQVVRELRLDNVEVVEGMVPGAVSGVFDVVTARAVAAPAALWQWIEGLLPSGGSLLVFAHTRRDEAGTEVDEAWSMDDENLSLPDKRVKVTYHEYRITQLEKIHTLMELQKA